MGERKQLTPDEFLEYVERYVRLVAGVAKKEFPAQMDDVVGEMVARWWKRNLTDGLPARLKIAYVRQETRRLGNSFSVRRLQYRDDLDPAQQFAGFEETADTLREVFGAAADWVSAWAPATAHNMSAMLEGDFTGPLERRRKGRAAFVAGSLVAAAQHREQPWFEALVGPCFGSFAQALRPDVLSITDYYFSQLQQSQSRGVSSTVDDHTWLWSQAVRALFDRPSESFETWHGHAALRVILASLFIVARAQGCRFIDEASELLREARFRGLLRHEHIRRQLCCIAAYAGHSESFCEFLADEQLRQHELAQMLTYGADDQNDCLLSPLINSPRDALAKLAAAIEDRMIKRLVRWGVGALYKPEIYGRCPALILMVATWFDELARLPGFRLNKLDTGKVVRALETFRTRYDFTESRAMYASALDSWACMAKR